MIYAVTAITLLAQQCAPEVATEAVVPLVLTESGGNSLAVNINGGPRVHAGSIAEAATIVRRYMAGGYSVDVGLAQINSRNFARLGLTVDEVLDPCTNLAAASTILQASYGLASRRFAGLDAISATYSLYNTGTLTRGLSNGYVGRVWSAASALGSIEAVPSLPVSPPLNADNAATLAKPVQEAEGWIVGQIASNTVEVFP